MIRTASGRILDGFGVFVGHWCPLEGVGLSLCPLEGVLGRLGTVWREVSLGPVVARLGASLGLLKPLGASSGVSRGSLGGLGLPGNALGRRARVSGMCSLSWASLGGFLGQC